MNKNIDNFNEDFLIKKAALSLVEKDNELFDLLEKDDTIINPNQDQLDEKIYSMINEHLGKNNTKLMKQKRLKKVLMKVAIFVLILTSGFAIPFVTVDAFREKILNYYIEKFETHSSFSPKEETEETTIITVEYIPNGYELRDETKAPNYHSLTYYNYNNKIFNIKLYNKDTTFSVDSEGCEEYTVYINREIGYIFRKTGYVTLLFRDSNYSIIISSNDDTTTNEELIKITEGIKR